MHVNYRADPFNESTVVFENRNELKNYIKDCGWYSFGEIKWLLKEFDRKGFVII